MQMEKSDWKIDLKGENLWWKIIYLTIVEMLTFYVYIYIICFVSYYKGLIITLILFYSIKKYQNCIFSPKHLNDDSAGY